VASSGRRGCQALAAFSLTGFYLLKRGAFDKLRNTNTVRALRCEITVVHGNVVSATELQGNGKLYFVPMGRQVISAQSLVKHYNKKFNLHITVLPEVAIDASACVAARKQCIAEEMILDMKRAYRKIAVDPDSVMIALTDEDIYPRSLGWDFTYAFHPDYQLGIVSTRRMDPVFWRHPRNDARRLANTWQMLTDYIAFFTSTFLEVTTRPALCISRSHLMVGRTMSQTCIPRVGQWPTWKRLPWPHLHLLVRHR